jgi:hypothetical protein
LLLLVFLLLSSAILCRGLKALYHRSTEVHRVT